MLTKFITKDFIERFMALNNKNANIQIKHLLYGNQKINKCVLRPILDEEHIGFLIEEEERYITMDELHYVRINDIECIIKSEVMELYINLL